MTQHNTGLPLVVVVTVARLHVHILARQLIFRNKALDSITVASIITVTLFCDCVLIESLCPAFPFQVGLGVIHLGRVYVGVDATP